MRPISKKRKILNAIANIDYNINELKVLLKKDVPQQPKAYFNPQRNGKLYTYDQNNKRVGRIRTVCSGDVIEYNPSEYYFRIK